MPRGRKAWLWSVIVGLWLALALPALAQSGSVRVEDPDNLLGSRADEVRQAAQQLADQGAQVIVIAAGASAGADEQGALAYLDNFLNQQNIAPNKDQLQPAQIVFYVPTFARLTSLYYGAQWTAKLDPVGDSIRDEQMSPRFAAGDIAGGMVAGINAVRTTINPPTPTGVYVIGGALAAAAAGAAAVPVLRRRRATADALTQARERWEQARRTAGAAIADLGQLVEQAQDKAQYDRISYSQSDVERLTQLQSKGVAVFEEAQAAFDAADEQQNAKATLAAGDYTAIAAQYDRSKDLAQQAMQLIREVEAQRATLDARGAPSTGPTTRLNE
jgi:hypothetical protein